jgi:hypothetical protein
MLALALGCSLPGCIGFRNWCGQRFAAPPPPCALPEDATQAEVVNYLNENTKKLRAWRTTNATIATRGGGILTPRVGAMIFVEKPRNFRLVAMHPMGSKEVDLGSNPAHFWFWNKHNEEKYVYQARHDQEPERMRKFPFPFQPDWIMEALGVIEIDSEKVLEMWKEQSRPQIVFLRADCVSPQGFKLRKVTAVDLCRGVIREHALYDARSKLVARAVLSEHVQIRDSDSNMVMLPRKIDLEWPQANLGLTLTLSDIEVNPEQFSPQTWTVPKIPDNPILDMTQ